MIAMGAPMYSIGAPFPFPGACIKIDLRTFDRKELTMTSVLSSVESRELPFLNGFECVVEYVQPGLRTVEYIDQYLALYRASNRGGSSLDARIVAIRIQRAPQLVQGLSARGVLYESSTLTFQMLLAEARRLVQPRLRHVEIYDVVDEILSSSVLVIPPEVWKAFATHLSVSEPPPPLPPEVLSEAVGGDQEPMTVKATPLGRSSQPSLNLPPPPSSSRMRVAPPAPRRPQPSRP